jgi:hypothetical protein
MIGRMTAAALAALSCLAAPSAEAQVDSVARGLVSQIPSTNRTMVQLNIQKLLRHAFSAQSTYQSVVPVMASPPTITVGSVNANSTIQTGSSINQGAIAANDPRFTVKGGLAWLSFGSTYQFKWPGSTPTAYSHLPNACISFGTDAAAFDLPLFASATDANIRVRVNGQWVSAVGENVGTDNTNWYYLKYSFGTQANRKIDICFGFNQYWRGINIPTNASLWKVVSTDEVLSLWEGDSYTAGTSYGNGSNIYSEPRNGFVYVAGEALGIDDPIALGEPGTGYIVAPSGENSISRINEITRFGNVNLIEDWQGINDSLTGQSTTALTTAVSTYLKAQMAAQPTAVIIVGGPWSGAGTVTPQAYYDAVKAGYQAVADPTRMCYIDHSPSGEYWQTGTGHIGATNGSGNSDVYIGPDGTHPYDATSALPTIVPSGEKYLGQRVAADTIKCLISLSPPAPTR